MPKNSFLSLPVLFLLLVLMQVITSKMSSPYHTIKVVDKETQRGIPMVNLTTTNMISHFTDSNGVVAFFELGLMDSTVYFEIVADGYEFDKDAIGFSGAAVFVSSGGRTVLNMTRTQIAHRLYRSTGEGIYRDSLMVGESIQNGKIATDFAYKKFLINSQVMGLDSSMMCLFKNRIYMFYGDTLKPSYVLGNFHATGATIDQSQLNIEFGLNISYITTDDNSQKINTHHSQATRDRSIRGESSFVKPMAPIEPLSEPTWIHDIVSLRDAQGTEHMMGAYYKPPNGDVAEKRGLIRWNEKLTQFEKIADVLAYERDHIWPVDGGHPLIVDNYVYFGQPYPMIRCKASVEGFTQLSSYEAFTCLKPSTTIPNNDLNAIQLDRGDDGKLIWSWKVNTSPLTIYQLNTLVEKGVIKRDEAYYLQLRSVDDPSKNILAAAGSVSWNQYRKKYVMIAEQSFGESSFIGEVWYSEADEPHGPYVYAKKVVTHKTRDFYNPVHYSLFDQQDGRIIFFEGTYVNTFDKAHPTPRYNYNQQMYKLDLADIKL